MKTTKSPPLQPKKKEGEKTQLPWNLKNINLNKKEEKSPEILTITFVNERTRLAVQQQS